MVIQSSHILLNIHKNNLNKNSPWAHAESEFAVLGVARNSLKYVVHISKKGKNKTKILLLQGAQTENNQFLASRNFRGY
jgi:hypothetical protein